MGNAERRKAAGGDAQPHRRYVGRADQRSGDTWAIPGARSVPLPRGLRPQLGTTAAEPPEGRDWLHELKFDGYRLLARLDGGAVQLLTRNGEDWTRRFPTVAQAVGGVGATQVVLDGEVVVLERDGTSSFRRLQEDLAAGRADAFDYYVFDLLYVDGRDLRPSRLEDRKAALARLLGSPRARANRVRYTEHVVGNGPEFYRQACSFGVEGIISKRRAGRYQAGRSRSWRKIKCLRHGTFVVGGFTDPRGGRDGFGSLLLGDRRTTGELVYAGRVGTGFDERQLRALRARLGGLETPDPPFTAGPVEKARNGVHWVRPELTVEVAFTEWTKEGVLRHPAFLRVYDEGAGMDSGARGGKRGRRPSPPRATPGAVGIAGVRVTHPDRVVYPGIELRKGELAALYAAVGEHVLQHIAGRPLTLIRCPSGIGGGCFFQKHAGDSLPDPLRRVDVEEEKGAAPYLYVDSVSGLVALVQMGVLEIHVWGSRVAHLERPDRMVFDLDPDPAVPWRRVVRAAREIRARLLGIGLPSFVKTTGGKGLHLAVPLVPEHDWPEVEEFARAVAEGVVRDAPGWYTASPAKRRREGRIFIDYLRNGRGATAIAAYSTRARAGAPVSMPLSWIELAPGRAPPHYDARGLRRRLAGGDRWTGMNARARSLTPGMKAALGLPSVSER